MPAYNAAQTYQVLGKHDKALNLFTRVTILNPKDWKAITKVIQENYALNNFSDAEKARNLLLMEE